MSLSKISVALFFLFPVHAETVPDDGVITQMDVVFMVEVVVLVEVDELMVAKNNLGFL